MLEKANVDRVKEALLASINHGIPCIMKQAESRDAMDYIELLEGQLVMLTEAIQQIKDISQTGLPTSDMTEDQWNRHRLFKVELYAGSAINKLVVHLVKNEEE